MAVNSSKVAAAVVSTPSVKEVRRTSEDSNYICSTFADSSGNELRQFGKAACIDSCLSAQAPAVRTARLEPESGHLPGTSPYSPAFW